jgi:RHS repeat-associated protein
MAGLSAVRRIVLIAIVLLMSTMAMPSSAQSYYGPPYSTDYIDGEFGTVGEALNAMASHWQSTCPECTFTWYFIYHDSGQVAATISPQKDTQAYGVFGTQYQYDPIKASGGCNPVTGGNGGGGASVATGGSGDGTDERRMCPGSTFAGDPINTYNGNKYQQDTDYRSAFLTLRRFYNATTAVAAAHVGARWRHTFDRALEIYLPYAGSVSSVALITLDRPDGSRERFELTNGAWVAPTDSVDTLTEIKDINGTVTGYAVFMGGPKETERYSAGGLLLSITKVSGATTTLAYSTATTPTTVAPAPNLLTTVTDPQGRVLAFAYDSASRISQVTLPDGGVLVYAYDAAGNLASVTYPDTGKRQYVYNEPALTSGASLPNAMTTLIDEKGVNFETTTYNTTGQAIASSFIGGVDTFTLDLPNAKVTTPLGQSTTLSYAIVQGASKVSASSTPCGDACNQPFQSQTYDANGWRTSVTDFRGHLNTMTYDAHGLEQQRVEAKGQPEQRTTTTTWDTNLRNRLTETVANAAGAVVAKEGWAYNARGQEIADCQVNPTLSDALAYTCSAAGTVPTGVRRTVSTYCDAVDTTQCPRVGLTLSVDGPRDDVADVVHYHYFLTTDESGCGTPGGACHHAGDRSEAVDAAGHVTRTLAYDKNGRAARRQDANGVIADLTYTPRGWLATRTVRANADGTPSSADATSTMTYEPTGALRSVTDPDGVALTYSYDGAHRLTDLTDGVGNHIHYTLDASGNRIKEQTFDTQNVERRSLTRTFNTMGQLVKVTDGLGQVTFDATAAGSYDLDGNLVQSKDALGTVHKDTYDALNRVVTAIDNYNGADAATKDSTSTVAFDALDQVTQVTDPDGLATTYGFDGLKNPASVTSPDAGAHATTFDVAGHPQTQTDAKGVTVTHAYDALGRNTIDSYADSQFNATYHYDEANGVTGCASSYPVGRLTRIIESAVTTIYCYDNQGRVSEKRQTQGTTTDITDYTYTHAGRLAGMASPSGAVIAYSRNTLGQITSVTVTPAGGAASAIVSTATYLPFGPVLSYTLGNGQSVTRAYDANYRATDVNSATFNAHYDRDAANQIVGFRDTPTTGTPETYVYDPLHRLTAVQSATFNESYTYNKTGDRLSKASNGPTTSADGAYGYQSGTHILAGVADQPVNFDANGSMIQNNTTTVPHTYLYDNRGRMVEAQDSGVVQARFAYNALGQRVYKSGEAGVKLRFVYDEDGQLLGEYGSLPRDYIWMDGLPVGALDGTVATFVIADAMGTPRRADVGDGSGSYWQWLPTRNPFGEGASFSAGYQLNLRFPGQYFDVETPVFYNGHRYYDPHTGRYLQSDPLGFSSGRWSTYAYAGSNPLNRIDPLGLQDVGDNYLSTPQVGGPPRGSLGCMVGVGVVVVGAAVLCAPTGPGEAICVPAAGIGAAAVLGCAGGAVMSGTMNEAAEDNEKDNVISFPKQNVRPWLICPPNGNQGDDDEDDRKKKNCQALKQSILNTCSGLSGIKQMKCFQAADESYQQCMSE